MSEQRKGSYMPDTDVTIHSTAAEALAGICRETERLRLRLTEREVTP